MLLWCYKTISPERNVFAVLMGFDVLNCRYYIQTLKLKILISSQHQSALLLRWPVFTTDRGNGQIHSVQDPHLRSPLQQTVCVSTRDRNNNNDEKKTKTNQLLPCDNALHVFIIPRMRLPLSLFSLQHSGCEPAREDCGIWHLHLHKEVLRYKWET